MSVYENSPPLKGQGRQIGDRTEVCRIEIGASESAPLPLVSYKFAPGASLLTAIQLVERGRSETEKR